MSPLTQQALTSMFGGRDPFSAPGYQPVSRDRGDREAAGGGELHGVDPKYVDAILRAFNGDIGVDELVRLAHDTSLRDQYALGGTGGLKDWLKDNNIPYQDLTGSKPRYTSVADEIAHMEPIARENYFRTQKERAEAEFRKDHEAAYSIYQKYFGQSLENNHALADQITRSGKDAVAQEDFVRALPSHLTGINIGDYTDLKGTADKTSQSIYGHAANDQIISELFNQDLRSASGVQYYYDQMSFQPGQHIDPLVYNAAYHSAQEFSQAVWNDNPHPMQVRDIWTAAGSPGLLNPQESAAMVAAAAAPNPGQQQPQQPSEPQQSPQQGKQQNGGLAQAR